MRKIVLKARINYHNTLTEGKIYVPVAQSKTGFLVEGDDNVIIDLYGHFFEIGIQNDEGNETVLLMSSEKFLSLKGAPAKEIERKEKPSIPIVETKEETEKIIPVVEENKLVSDDFELDDLIDDFVEENVEVLEETKDTPEASNETQGLDIDIEDF
jgi:hypothetical protein